MPTDPLKNGISLVVAIGGFLAKPSLLDALKTGLSIHDTLKKMLAQAPPGIATLANDLTASARPTFDGFADLPPDAEILYEQMVIAALPDPQTIVTARMDPAAITTAMLANLTDRAHLRPPMPDLFRDLTQPVLDRLLAEKSFADDLTPAFMAAVLQDLGNVAEKLDNLAAAGRDLMEALAARFQIPDAFDLSDAALRAELEKKAQDYRALKREVDAIDPAMKRLSNLKAAAQDAIARVDLEEVENLLLLVQTTELEEAAKTAELRADNALLRGKVEDAYRILSAAADSFASVDPLEPARRRMRYEDRLYRHGLRYGGAGLGLAADMNSAALAVLTREDHPVDWATTQQNLAVALEAQGARTAGPDSAAVLAEAVEANRAALTVRTREDYPEIWAAIQQNLGIALRTQGIHAGEAEGADLLAMAVASCCDALTVLTRERHPVQWAQAHRNLGNAYLAQGTRSAGPEDAALLAQAVAAYRAALTVVTRENQSVDWAGTQQNLAFALKAQGSRTSGPDGSALLANAVDAYHAALTVRTREDRPVEWAMTMENVALAEEAIADHDTTTDPRPHLEAALTDVEAALTVFDPEHMAFNHEKAKKLRDHLKTCLTAL